MAEDRFAKYKLDAPIDRDESYKWAILYEMRSLQAELKAIRAALEDKPKKT